MQIPFLSLAQQHQSLGPLLAEAVERVSIRGRFVLDANVRDFEQAWALYHRVPHAVGVGNGFDALYLSLRAGGIGAGDDVLVPAHTCSATWAAIVHTGARPVPVDVDNTMTLDPKLLADCRTAQTRAIVAVHLYGYPCDMQAVTAFARHYRLWLVEDNAQAQGALVAGTRTGAWGDAGATSFYPTKNLGAWGDAGAITTSHEQVAAFVRKARNYGGTQNHYYEQEGINSRLDEIQAAVLLVKLTALETWNEERARLAERYQALLASVQEVDLPPRSALERKGVHHLFVIRTAYRDALQSYLASAGIETALHYPVLPVRQAAFAAWGWQPRDYPQALRCEQEALSLPLYPGLAEEAVEYVADKVREFFISQSGRSTHSKSEK